MDKVTGQIQCPSCSGQLTPRILECTHCDIKVEGQFQWNEFATLSAEDLHLLRLFVHCEGRVRDMEPALGLTYPTIRNRIGQLKKKLQLETTPGEMKTSNLSIDDVLDSLESGRLSFDEALYQIKTKEGSR